MRRYACLSALKLLSYPFFIFLVGTDYYPELIKEALRPASAEQGPRCCFLAVGLTSDTPLFYVPQSGPVDLTEGCGPASQALHWGLVVSNDTDPKEAFILIYRTC